VKDLCGCCGDSAYDNVTLTQTLSAIPWLCRLKTFQVDHINSIKGDLSSVQLCDEAVRGSWNPLPRTCCIQADAVRK
jgi:hypothetical protein